MKMRLMISFFFVMITCTVVAQPRLIGMMYGYGYGSHDCNGSIIQYIGGSDSLYRIDTFSSNSYNPRNVTITEGANGKMYGTNVNGTGANTYGSVVCYDVNTNSHRVVANLDSIKSTGGTWGELLLAPNGLYYGTSYGITNQGVSGGYTLGGIFSYNPITDTVILVYSWVNYGWSEGLMQASDGNLYGQTSGSDVASGNPWTTGYATIFRFDPYTNTFTTLASITDPNDVMQGTLVEAGPDTLYGFGSGFLGMYYISLSNNTLSYPAYPGLYYNGAIRGSDGLLYGTTLNGGAANEGKLFSYDTHSGVFDTLHVFGLTAGDGQAPYGIVCQASDGNLYGCTHDGGIYGSSGTLFQYNIATQTYTTMLSFDTTGTGNHPNLGHLVEYQPVAHHISAQLCSGSLCSGGTVSMYAADSCTFPAAVQWQVSTDGGSTYTNIDTAPSSTYRSGPISSSTYIFTPTGGMAGYLYRAIFASGDTTQPIPINTLPTSIESDPFCLGDTLIIRGQLYGAAGTYYDTLYGAGVHGCDSIITLQLSYYSDSIHAGFSLMPSSTPHLWYAVNQCTGLPPLSYIWNWGDGSPTSTGDTPSHVYDSAGYYIICVTVIDSNGCYANYCDTSVYLFKDQSAQMVYVNVLPQYPDGLLPVMPYHFGIRPNPALSTVEIDHDYSGSVTARLFSTLGIKVADYALPSSHTTIDVSALSAGIYELQFMNEQGTRLGVLKLVKE